MEYRIKLILKIYYMLGNKSLQKSPAGFTLVELLVTLGLVSLLGLLLVGVYVQTSGAQRRIMSRHGAVGSLQYGLEVLAQYIRTSEIDYSFYRQVDGSRTIPQPTTALAVITPDGRRAVYQMIDNALVAVIDGVSYRLTDPTSGKIENISFLIDPATDPFIDEQCTNNADCAPNPALGCSINNVTQQSFGFCRCATATDCRSGVCDTTAGLCGAPDSQPQVTVIMTVTVPTTGTDQQQQVVIQTTVTSRIYKR